MRTPVLFKVTYFIGINPYYCWGPKYLFFVFNLLTLTYIVAFRTLKTYYTVKQQNINSISLIVFFFRTSLVIYTLMFGILKFNKIQRFYEKVMSLFGKNVEEKKFRLINTFSLVLFLTIIVEMHLISNLSGLVAIFSSFLCGAYHIGGPLMSMMLFTLCCAAVENSFNTIKEELKTVVPQTASISFARLRKLHTDVQDLIKDISDMFGNQVLLYIVVLNVVVLEKVDILMTVFVTKTFSWPYILDFVGLVGYLLAVWFIAMYCSKAISKVRFL